MLRAILRHLFHSARAGQGAACKPAQFAQLAPAATKMSLCFPGISTLCPSCIGATYRTCSLPISHPQEPIFSFSLPMHPIYQPRTLHSLLLTGRVLSFSFFAFPSASPLCCVPFPPSPCYSCPCPCGPGLVLSPRSSLPCVFVLPRARSALSPRPFSLACASLAVLPFLSPSWSRAAPPFCRSRSSRSPFSACPSPALPWFCRPKLPHSRRLATTWSHERPVTCSPTCPRS